MDTSEIKDDLIKLDYCPLSESKHIHKVLEAKDHTVSSRNFSVYETADIGFRFTNPFPSEESISAYYQSADYISHSESNKGLINNLYKFARLFTIRSKSKLVQSVHSSNVSGKLLDYGCGTGAFLHQMQKYDWQVSGIEPDENARKIAEERTSEKISDLSAMNELPDKSFDVITLWHVLEHVHQLHPTMKDLKRLLKPEGSLLIALPNFRSYDADYYGNGWAGYDVPRHLYHFSPASLKLLAEKHHFKLVSMKRMPLDSFYVSMLSEKNKKGSLIRGVYYGFLSWFRSIFRPGKCSSIIYILKHD